MIIFLGFASMGGSPINVSIRMDAWMIITPLNPLESPRHGSHPFEITAKLGFKDIL